jgi:hypothetical protein
VDEVVMFTHAPKCGGTSLRLSISNAMRQEEIFYVYGQPISHGPVPFHKEASYAREIGEWDGYDELIDTYLGENPQIRLMYGHHTPFVDSVSSRKVRAFTMVRHPYTAYVSYYNHSVRQWGEKRPFEDWVKVARGNKRRMSYEDVRAELCKYENVFFFEEYSKSLERLSAILGVELSECRKNISARHLERSDETDRLVDKHLTPMLELYDFLRERFG